MKRSTHHGNQRSRNADLEPQGHEKGKVYRRLPLEESHWSFDNFEDRVNKSVYGLKARRKGSKTWVPDESQIAQIMAMVGASRETAILVLQQAMKEVVK